MDEDTKAMALRNFAITLWKKGSPEATKNSILMVN